MLAIKNPSLITFLMETKTSAQITLLLCLGAIVGFVQLVSFLETALQFLN